MITIGILEYEVRQGGSAISGCGGILAKANVRRDQLPRW